MRAYTVRRLKPSVLALQLVLRRAELGVLKSETVSPSISVVEVGVLPFLGLKRSRIFDGDFEHPTCKGKSTNRE